MMGERRDAVGVDCCVMGGVCLWRKGGYYCTSVNYAREDGGRRTCGEGASVFLILRAATL